MKNIAKIIIFLLITTITFSCYKQVEFTEFESADFDMKKNKGKIILYIKMNNPNFYKVKIVETDLRIYLNDKYLGDVKDINQIILPVRNETIVEIPLQITLMNIFFNAGNISDFFLDSKDLKIKIEGDVVGKTIFGRKKMEVNHEKNISNIEK
ncbi:MAG: LEA type 2 family protein [Bacteroidota bacterium]|nr:LEA type 2 family protein [Bacteroidota bacterium]